MVTRMSDISELLERFRRGAEMVAVSITGAAGAELDWAPEPGKWSIRKIVAHLADSEVVATTRFRHVIAEENPKLEAYDQNAWAEKLDYDRRKTSQALESFRRIRAENYELLKDLPVESVRSSGHPCRARAGNAEADAAKECRSRREPRRPTARAPHRIQNLQGWCQMKNFVSRLLLATAAVALYAATDFNAEGNRWWSHIQYLANDDMKGRNTGSPEHLKAAHYVAGEFERSGLKPAGTSDYLQPVKFDVKQIVEDQSSLALVRNGKKQPLVLGDDATLALRGDIQENTEAGAVFVGYGLQVPEKKYDDLAGLDLKGKIAVYLAGGPASIPGPLKSHYQSAGERWKYLKAAGVVGIATIQNPKSMDIPWSRARLARFMPAMSLADPALDETQGLRLSVTINPEHADKFFAGSGHTIAEILADADSEKPLPHFPLAASIAAHVQLKKSQVESQNVAGHAAGLRSKVEERIRGDERASGPRRRGRADQRRFHLQRRDGRRFRHRVHSRNLANAA